MLAICGSLNQTTMMHAVGRELADDCDVLYTPYYADGVLKWLNGKGFLDFTIMGPGSNFLRQTSEYMADHQLPLDPGGSDGPYDLVLTCSDLIVQRNIRGRPIILIQEGMTDPEDTLYHLVRKFKLPRWLASTATTGLSLAYRRFCVASEGYRQHFHRKGVPLDRLVVTGIPNYDNCAALLDNDFPLRDYVLVATSDTRETFKRDDRRTFFDQIERIARGRPLVFKLHPNENAERSTAEIQARFGPVPVYHTGNTGHMIANCQALICQYSTVVYTGLALGKECHSYFDMAELRRLLPVQNGGTSARNMAAVCREVIEDAAAAPRYARAAG
ncbi:MAG: hypothetical protein NW201_11570 [Gemmatimonadales bacterium]|nr:hypothetical protein [Gemmatimonadales bacterium]